MVDHDNVNFPAMIGRYQVLRLLGSGAMGCVVLAEDPRIKRKVAIKLMKLDAVRTEVDQREYLARFQREAEVSGLLNHPGIVAIYDVGEVEGYGPFLAMEFVPGRPLDGLMKGGVALATKEKLRIAGTLAEALDHAHAKGIVHRDVKPGNVMVGDDGRPKLMDFGIAKHEDASLTQTGTFLGTPSYASPEQIREGTVDSRSDIFSFGVLVFELMSGQSPFPGTSINTILYRIVNEPPLEVKPPVLGVLPEGWKRIFDKVLAKQPEDRYPSCTAFVRDLLDAVVDLSKEERREVLNLMRMTQESTLPVIVSTAFDETMVVARPEPRHSVRLWGSILALSILVGGGLFFLKGSKGAQLQIASRPLGAKVFVNDLPGGTTPVNTRLVPGDLLRLEMKGHQPITFELKTGEAPPVFDLQPIVTEEQIDSEPKGAKILLDGKELDGSTPYKVQWNHAIEHSLHLTKDTLYSAMQFMPGETPGGRAFELKERTTAATLQEPPLDPNAPGSIKLLGGFSVRVKVDGKDLGELSPGSKPLPLPPGTHKVEFASTRYYYRDSHPVTISAGQTSSLTVPGLARLTVSTHPGIGKVLVDGQDTEVESDGSNPIPVAHGRHVITVRGAKGTTTKPEAVDVNRDLSLDIHLPL